MGYGTRDGQLGHTIRTFWPDETDTKIYIPASDYNPSMEELMGKIEEKWPGSSMGRIQIGAEHIQTDCLGYDLYDSSDYTMFITIEKI